MMISEEKKNRNHSSVIVKGFSVSVSSSGGAADKGQPSIIVSHLWASVPGSVTLLISIMLACLQWTGAHQLASLLAHRLCRLTAWHTKKNPAWHNNTEVDTNTPQPLKQKNTPYVNKAAQVFFSRTNIMNMNNTLEQTLPDCAILFCLPTLKMSTRRQKGKLKNKSDNKMGAHDWP